MEKAVLRCNQDQITPVENEGIAMIGWVPGPCIRLPSPWGRPILFCKVEML